MSIEIRTLSAADEHVLDRVADDVFDHALNAWRLAEFLRDRRHHLVVALDAGVVVGMASAVHYVHPDKDEPELWINEVGVAPTHRGRRLARQLLQELLRAGQAAGCREAWVLTERSNQPAMRLYASLAGDEPLQDQVMFTFRLNGGPDSRSGRPR